MSSSSSAECEKFTDIIAKFAGYAAKRLPDDVMARLKEMSELETSPMAKIFYGAMFKNMEMAVSLDRPLCQDTGTIQFFVSAGSRFPLLADMADCLRAAVLKATAETPLRPNVVEIFDEKNTGTNVGTRIPWIDWEILPDKDYAEIYLYMAGGGCSLPGQAKVLMPLEGYGGLVRFVFDQITSYGVNACPPLAVGIGIAGSAEVAAKLSKKALLRPFGSRNENPRGAELERMIADGLNGLGIGPGGVAGRSSVMEVSIEQAGRHPANLAVGLSTGCWAHRRALIRVGGDLSYEIISHKGAAL